MMKQQPLRQGGFTIIELMISTAVLATMLLLVTVLMLNIGNLYYKGINQARVQDATRTISDDVTQHLQLSDKIPGQANGPNSTHAYCIGNVRYTYVTGVQIGQPAPGTTTPIYRHVLWRDTNPTPGNCIIDSSVAGVTSPVTLTSSTPSSDPNGTEMMPPNSRLTTFSVDGTPPINTSPYRLSVRLAYGSNDLLCNNFAVPGSCAKTATEMKDWSSYVGGNVFCKGHTGDSFCSTAALDTTVVQRL